MKALTSPLAYSVFFVLVSTTIARGQWPNDPTVNSPVCTAGNDQTLPQSVSDGSGGVILAWRDDRSGPSNGNIFAQRFSSTGTALWTANGVAICTAANSQANVALIPDGAGGAIITWQDPRLSAFNNDIYAQRINSAGAVQWTANGVAISTAADHQSAPAITSDGNSGAIIAWHDQRNGFDVDLYAQRINSSGVVQWTADGVAVATGAFDQFHGGIVSDGAGGIIVTWMFSAGVGGPDILAQRVNSSGVLQWTPSGVPIAVLSESQDSPGLVADGAGGAIIAWSDGRPFPENDLYAQRVNATGVVQWTANGVPVCSATNNQQFEAHDIVSDGSNGAIIAWTDLRNGSDVDIYAQRISGTGATQWSANGVLITGAASNQVTLCITSDDSGGAIVAWEDSRVSFPDVYAQRISAAGSVLWAVNGAAISTATDTQMSTTVTSNGSGGAIIAWEDFRSGGSDIYTQGVASGGTLCSPPASPGTISGATTVAEDTNQTYTVVDDPAASSYIWTLPAGWSGSSTTNSINVVVGSIGGTLSVTASDACGASTASTLDILVTTSPATSTLVIYNAVSTHADNKNDGLFIENINAAPFQLNKLTIFNRWGSPVFEATNYDNSTNAFMGLSSNGDLLPSGTYYYTLEFSSGEPKRTGFISLRR